MNLLSSSSNALLSVVGNAFLLTFLFCLCFFFVLLVRYALLGYRVSKQRTKKEPDKTAEPKYYLVERKRKTSSKQPSRAAFQAKTAFKSAAKVTPSRRRVLSR